MPGNPFHRPASRSRTRAGARSPQKVSGRKTYVPTPTSPIGLTGKKVRAPSTPAVKRTTKSRKNVTPPHVRQGAQMGTPGRSGS